MAKGKGKAKGKKIEKDEQGRNPIRTFMLHDPETKEPLGNKFKGRTPSQAGKKVAKLGYKDFALRETGTRKLRHYSGKIEQREVVDPSPEWMRAVSKENGDGELVFKANIGHAKYNGIEHLGKDAKLIPDKE